MKKINNTIFGLAILMFGLVAAGMIFLPVLIYNDTNSSFTGVQAVFGTEFASLGILGSGQIEMNVLGIIAFALPLVAGIIAVFVNNYKGAIVSIALFAAGAILLFLLPSFATTTITVLGETSAVDVSWTMGNGLIIAACASIIGAVLSLVKLLLPNAKTN